MPLLKQETERSKKTSILFLGAGLAALGAAHSGKGLRSLRKFLEKTVTTPGDEAATIRGAYGSLMGAQDALEGFNSLVQTQWKKPDQSGRSHRKTVFCRDE